MDSDINAQLQRIETLLLISSKNILNAGECAMLLGVGKDRIYHLANAREIPHYKQGARIYFKKNEIEAWLTERYIPTKDEIRAKAKFKTNK